MSDQPESTGEWTAERVAGYAVLQDGNELLAEDINAALAAEREKYETAEREYQRMVKAKFEADVRIQQLRDQLADTIKASNEVTDENIDLERQLADAQAAIARANAFAVKYPDEQVYKIPTDTTALDAAIAEAVEAEKKQLRSQLATLLNMPSADRLDAAISAAQQPLVDALEKLRETQKRNQKPIIDAALAKVK